LIVAATAAVVFFTNLGGPSLWDRDEPRNAGCAAEMWERGDWIVPTFNDELRAHKPALLYWLMMTAYAVGGVNEFSARFWSAALGAATCLLTYGIGSRLYRPSVGLWAGVALATALNFGVAARAATPRAETVHREGRGGKPKEAGRSLCIRDVYHIKTCSQTNLGAFVF